MSTGGKSSKPAGDSGLFVGLMSGTSVDGIDAALVRFEPQPRLLLARTYPLPAQLAEQVLRCSQRDALVSLDTLGMLDTLMGRALAEAVNALLLEAGTQPAQIRAVGSHGQTLRHRPTGDAPFTLQVGDPNTIAELTGITTVADFRRRDVAAGGHGAPLVPAFHAAVLSGGDEPRAVLNIGGIANLTLLDSDGSVRGFDTGPGNGLMDAWVQQHRDQPFDRDGAFASAGRGNAELLRRMLSEPWLKLPPPKSTGRDQFHLGWLESHLSGLDLAAADVQATLVEFSAETITAALLCQMPTCRRVLVCGGGVHNPVLMRALRARLADRIIESTAEHGMDPDFVEAMAFAWLARESLSGRPGNVPAVTGAAGPRILGSVFPGRS